MWKREREREREKERERERERLTNYGAAAHGTRSTRSRCFPPETAQQELRRSFLSYSVRLRSRQSRGETAHWEKEEREKGEVAH